MGMFDFMGSAIMGFPGLEESREDVINTVLENGVIVDTCEAFDTHKWETGICRDDCWEVPEQYRSREEAVIGHDKWVEKMKENPELEIDDVIFGEWEEDLFGDDEDD